MEEREYIEDIERRFLAIIKQRFPEMNVNNWGSTGPVFTAEYSESNSAFRNSDYFYSKTNEFLHITNIRTSLVF